MTDSTSDLRPWLTYPLSTWLQYCTSVSQQITICDLLAMSMSVISPPTLHLTNLLSSANSKHSHQRANDKLVTQVLCFMFLHYCLLFHMEIGSIEANWSSANNGPIDSPEEQF